MPDDRFPTGPRAPGVWNAAASAGATGKRRKWIEDVFPSSLVRATSSLDLLCGDGGAADLQPDGVLDPCQTIELAFPPPGIVDLQHERRDQRVARRDQRVVGLQLARNLLLAALLDVEHLVHLHPHGLEALEVKGGEGADGEPAVALQRRGGGAALVSDLGIVRHVHDVGPCERPARPGSSSQARP